MSRYDDALYIQQGASNPAGIARSLVKAIDECHAENMDTASIRNDPAVRLITHQLAYLMSISQLDGGISAYREAMEICYSHASEQVQSLNQQFAPLDRIHAASK
jgi:hypothetical protein